MLKMPSENLGTTTGTIDTTIEKQKKGVKQLTRKKLHKQHKTLENEVLRNLFYLQLHVVCAFRETSDSRSMNE